MNDPDPQLAPAAGYRPKDPFVCEGGKCDRQHYRRCGHHVSWRHGLWRALKAPSFLGGEIEGEHIVYICPCEAAS